MGGYNAYTGDNCAGKACSLPHCHCPPCPERNNQLVSAPPGGGGGLTRQSIRQINPPYVQEVQQDTLLWDLLNFPAGTDLHDHPLVEDGSIILQVALLPQPSNQILLH